MYYVFRVLCPHLEDLAQSQGLCELAIQQGILEGGLQLHCLHSSSESFYVYVFG